MATFQPILNKSDIKPFISPGVQDNSIAELIGDVGKAGVEAYTGYQLGEHTQRLQDITTEYFASQSEEYRTPEAEREGALAGSLEIANNEFFNQMPDTPESVRQLDVRNKELDKQLSKYQNAVAQGRMSLGELQTRILSSTREAINQNPFLQQQLMQTADKYMELSGLGSFIKEQEKIQKSQQQQEDDIRKNMWSQAEKFNIAGFRNMDLLTLNNALNKEMQAEYVRTTAKKNQDYGDVLTKDQAKEWLNKVDPYTYGHYSQLNTAIQNTFKEANTTTYAPVMYRVRELLSGAKEEYKKNIPAVLRSEPAVKEAVADYEKRLDGIESRLSKLGSGEDAATAAKNEFNTLKDMQETSFRKRFKVEELDLIAKLAPLALPSILGENSEKLKEYVASTVTGLFESASFKEGLPTKETSGNNPAEATLKAAGIVGSRDKDWSGLNKVMTTYNKAIVNIPEAKDRQFTSRRFLKNIADMDLTGIDSESSLKVKELIDNHLNDKAYGVGAILSTINKYNEQGKNISIDIFENGNIAFLSPDKDVTSALNEGYGTSIVNALNIYSQLHGMSKKEAANGFYQEYFAKDFPKVMEDKDLQTNIVSNKNNNPGNLKDTKGNFRTFSSIEDGIEAGENQILRYLTLGSPINGQPVRTIKDVIDNWRPASDRRGEKDISQEEYYKEVSKLSGVPLDTPIVPTKENISKIFKAISRIEGGYLSSYEERLSNNKDYGYGKREDGTNKGLGFFGGIPTKNGQKMTELSFEADGIFAPLLVPTLTREEINLLVSGQKPTEAIYKKAIAHAKKRITEGKSPFANEGEQQSIPLPSGMHSGSSGKIVPAKESLIGKKKEKK